MKKSVIISLLALLIAVHQNHVAAAEYLSYQETEFEHDGMVFLDDYPDSTYETYYPKVDKKRFWGWRIFIIYKTEKVFYTKETLYMIYNGGTSEITETFRFETSSIVKKQYNCSGSIGLDGTGTVKGFKLGLDSKLDASITATTTDTVEEEISIKVLVDPGTTLLVQVKGEGQVSNGVAAYYTFWKQIRRGGWEVFVVTTEYYSIVKEMIEE